MSFYIKLDSETDIQLPVELELKERIEFCDEIINENPQCFDMALSGTSHRLEIMANYILEVADKGGEYPVLTTYKEKRNKIREKKFSELEEKYDNNDGFY